MKKNVLFFVVDSFIYKKLGSTKYGPSATPFLDKLAKESLVCTNLYSQGPFTEAGNKALLTGSDSLNDGGYMHNLNESENIYLDVFKQNGYETFEFYLPFYMYSNKDFKNMDHQYFTCDFIFESVYGNRLSYWGSIQKERPLEEYEYNDIIKQLDLTFQAWEHFLSQENTEWYECINRITVNYDWTQARLMLSSEKQSFYKNKRLYADQILEKGREHNMYKIPNCKLDDYVDDIFVKTEVYDKYKVFLKQASRKQFWANLKNQPIEKRRLFSSLFESIKKRKLTGYAKSVSFSLFCYKLMYAFRKGNFYQQLPSIRNCTDTLVRHLRDRDNNRPFFVHMHMEELHNRSSFFTYDLNNKDYIQEEFALYQQYLSNLRKDYKGQLLYDFALLYTDLCLSHLFVNLDKMGVLKDTLVVITADHGSSYGCEPLRDIYTNNHHSENYHIPLIIFDGSKKEGREIVSYHTSKDVLPTIYEMCGIVSPANINGKPIDAPDNQNDYAITEYMGGGCPDMVARPIQFMIRNRHYLVCYNVKMTDDFEKGELVEVYDLEKDPEELVNIRDQKQSDAEVKALLNHIRNRKEEILLSFRKKHPNYPI